METAKLKRFARFARSSLIQQVSTKLRAVLAEDSLARRESVKAIKELEEAIRENGEEQVIERVAYIWFNRFCALRFMDVNRYTHIGVVTPAEGQFRPEILAEAMMGHIDEEVVNDKTRQKILALLNGRVPSRNPQSEAYRLLLVATCNYWNRTMSFLFEPIDDYTELLLPDDLLSGNSILAYTREAMTSGACKEVEVVGWLYQFYISEKKDEVFAGMRKNKKATPENIPAATQTFTPDWIVRYLVENSLGRLWMLNHPDSKLTTKMRHYVKPEQPETDFLRIGKPEEIKICDPACGSGHILTYAFDLLYAIYEEEGYEPAEISKNILSHNLYGIEIDERAGLLAAFALTMKARSRQRHFFRRQLAPNICVLENIRFTEDELKHYTDTVGQELFTEPLLNTLHQFEEANNFGSLIRPHVTDAGSMLKTLESKDDFSDLLLNQTHKQVLRALRQADYLSPKYHAVIANPPYMGSGKMNKRLKAWTRGGYPDSKADLFAMFIERNLELAVEHGLVAMITRQGWMFLSSYQKLRAKLLKRSPIQNMAHLGANAFDSIGGAVVSTTAFVLQNSVNTKLHGQFIDLRKGRNEREKEGLLLEAVSGQRTVHSAEAEDFEVIQGTPIVYWLPPALRRNFLGLPPITDVFKPSTGLQTGDNDRFLRQWFEVSFQRICFSCGSIEAAKESPQKWFPHNKGGTYRKWYGNQSFVLNWENDGSELRKAAINASGGKHASIKNLNRMFQECITWSDITTSSFAARYFPKGFLFDVSSPSGIPNTNGRMDVILSLLCSKLMPSFMECINPTHHFSVGDLARVPYESPPSLTGHGSPIQEYEPVLISKEDWDAYETSWNFNRLPLLCLRYRQPTLEATYQRLRAHWQEMTLKMQQLEKANNRAFIDAYELRNELKSEVLLSDITLSCNPHYRYGGNKSEEELETLLLADTMRELVSYAVGCMFGRYALEKPGLILANQDETVNDYLKQVLEPSIRPDQDNVIPVLGGDWFPDDISERFREFLRATFGNEHYEANLKFVEKALGKNGRPRDIRDYFLKDFYSDHVKRYKKRPIYWLFSSPNGSFNALIYMHRYRSDTVSVVLNDYLREFGAKLASRKSHLEAISINANVSRGEKTKALKEIEKVSRILNEMKEYEHEVLYPLATRKVSIDLDDGVKVNYPKFGTALKKIAGL